MGENPSSICKEEIQCCWRCANRDKPIIELMLYEAANGHKSTFVSAVHMQMVLHLEWQLDEHGWVASYSTG